MNTAQHLMSAEAFEKEAYAEDAQGVQGESTGRDTLDLAHSSNQSLRGCVERAMENYFRNLDGQPVSDVYEMVMAEVEAPMLEIVLKYTRHNQTKAAQVLGLNRGTLRKKLKQYGLL